MASRVVTQLISDLSGEEIREGKGETVEFAYRGTLYTIDLTAKEADAFDKSIAPYVDHASKQGSGRRSARRSRASGGDPKEIRAWARRTGLTVPDRGRIPGDVRSQYEAAH